MRDSLSSMKHALFDFQNLLFFCSNILCFIVLASYFKILNVSYCIAAMYLKK